ncbi:hypothetical protein VTK26DRAFT_5883 [Humicola hyalothermophila]
MKFSLPILLSLASLALGQSPASCPTATRTMQNRACSKTCAFTDCSFQTTIRNPCGCPATVPTATLIVPCEADCPYQGCDIEFHTTDLPCPTPTSSSTTPHWPGRPTTTTTSSSTPTGVVTIITVLPPRTTSTPTPTCPTVTRTTMPANCTVLRCPVPTCRTTSSVVVPCGCTPKTVLYVQGCPTACPEGCLTRTETTSLAC